VGYGGGATEIPYIEANTLPLRALGKASVENHNSGYGVASFVASIVGSVATAMLIGIVDLKSFTLTAGLLWIAFLLLDVLALGLGITGLLEVRRRKRLASVGCAVSSLTLVAACLALTLDTAAA
jgi:hypothetical protein